MCVCVFVGVICDVILCATIAGNHGDKWLNGV